MTKAQFLYLIERSQETNYVMLFVEMVCCGCKDLVKHKYTVWQGMEFVIFWLAGDAKIRDVVYSDELHCCNLCI